MRSLIVIVALIATACEAPTTSGEPPGPRATNAATAELLPASVLALPSFDFASYERLLFQLRGTPVVVNLWASWCGPCRNEAPALDAAARRYGTDVQFLGVDFKDDRGSAVGYLKQYDIRYPSVVDPSGEIHNRLGFVGLPDTLFYGADGSIVQSWSGPITSQALASGIARIAPATRP